MAQQATDTFVTEINGAPISVQKGDVLPEGHPVLKHLGADVSKLFRKLVEDLPKPAAKTAKAPVKTDG